MKQQTVTAIFPSERAADEAKAALVARGVRSGRIVTSADMTADALAAEAPGESYGNRQYDEALRAGSCALSVNACSRKEEHYLAELMRRHGGQPLTP